MVIMKECKVDSRDLVYENTDKLALCDVGKSPKLVQCIEDLPEGIPANDPRVDLIVKSLFSIDDAHPIEEPVSLRDLNKLIKDGAIPLISISDVTSEIKGVEYTPQDIEMDLGNDELEIYKEIQKSTCCTIDSIAHNLNKNAGKVSAILTVLEIKGVITTYGGKVFLAK